MKLDGYLEYINESVIDIELSIDEMKQYFGELSSEGYNVSFVTFYGCQIDGRLSELTDYDFKTDCPEDGGDIHVGYCVVIEPSGIGDEDLTSIFQQIVKRILSQGYELTAVCCNETSFYHDDKWDEKLLEYRFVDGKVVTDIWSGEHQSDVETNIQEFSIDLIQTYPQEFNFEFVKEAFGVAGEEKFEVEFNDMVDIFVSDYNDNYPDVLKGGTFELEDNYEFHYYYPENWRELFDYYMSQETIEMLLRAIIRQDGLEAFIENCYDGSKFKGKTEDEMVEFLSKERFYRTMDFFEMNDFECVEESLSNIAGERKWSHIQTNYDELVSAFEDILEDKLTSGYTKKENDKGEVSYEVYFDLEWIKSFESSDLSGYNTYDIMNEYYAQEGREKLSVNFSDWGDYDSKELDKYLQADIKRYLTKGS